MSGSSTDGGSRWSQIVTTLAWVRKLDDEVECLGQGWQDPAEKQELIVNCDHLENLKFSPVNPRAFTEHGAIMAASVLSSTRAIEVSVFVVRAFVQLREVLSGHKELAQKIAQLERKLGDHDQQIHVLVEAIKQLIDPKLPPKTRRIGFRDD